MSQLTTVASSVSSLNRKTQRFESSVGTWTLRFHDPEIESAFIQTYDESIRFSAVSRLTMFICVGFAAAYRLFAIGSLLAGADVKTGSLAQEVFVLALQLVVIAVEIALAYLRPRATLRGSFLYVFFPTMILYAAFFTQSGPNVGITYLSAVCTNPVLGASCASC